MIESGESKGAEDYDAVMRLTVHTRAKRKRGWCTPKKSTEITKKYPHSRKERKVGGKGRRRKKIARGLQGQKEEGGGEKKRRRKAFALLSKLFF